LENQDAFTFFSIEVAAADFLSFPPKGRAREQNFVLV